MAQPRYLDEWMKDAEEQGRQSQTKDVCGYCGRAGKHDRADCPAKDKTCSKCNKAGHFKIVCRSSGNGGGSGRGQLQSRGRGRSQSRGGAGVKSIRVNLSRVEDAEDDAEPTPLMTDVTITPQTGTPFLHDVFPDTGCYQSLISLDLVTANGMVVDKRKKKTLRAVNGFALKCCGAVTFQVAVGGQRTGVLACRRSTRKFSSAGGPCNV